MLPTFDELVKEIASQCLSHALVAMSGHSGTAIDNGLTISILAQNTRTNFFKAWKLQQCTKVGLYTKVQDHKFSRSKDFIV